VYWIVWSFDVKPAQVKAFERAYGPDGDWVSLFQCAPGFAGTELRREPDRPAHYLTIDRWRTRDDYNRFKELAAPCAALTESEAQSRRL
jgi:heme-degrading monooxygenase HmoA